MNCYFDGSVGGEEGQWLTLAGFIATDETWAVFQRQWETMLRERYPIAPYIHMTDLITGNDPFERRAGWTDCKVNRLISDVIVLFQSIDKTTIRAFACSIDVKAHARLLTEGYKIIDPAVICAENGLGLLLSWYLNTHGSEKAYLFYDRSEPFIKSIESRWREFTSPRNRHKNTFWNNIADVVPVTMDDKPGIQAADVVAWAVTRKLRGTPEKWTGLADILIGTRDSDGILPTTQIDPITEQLMRSKYSS